MTPAIKLAKQQSLDYKLHEYTHDSTAASFGLEAVEKLGITAERVFKTLVVTTDAGALAVAILPVDKTLNFKKVAKALSSTKMLACKKYKWLSLNWSNGRRVMCSVALAHWGKKAPTDAYPCRRATASDYLCEWRSPRSRD